MSRRRKLRAQPVEGMKWGTTKPASRTSVPAVSKTWHPRCLSAGGRDIQRAATALPAIFSSDADGATDTNGDGRGNSRAMGR